jgi:hypothetical protein
MASATTAAMTQYLARRGAVLQQSCMGHVQARPVPGSEPTMDVSLSGWPADRGEGRGQVATLGVTGMVTMSPD